jgi:hypothetical protein
MPLSRVLVGLSRRKPVAARRAITAGSGHPLPGIGARDGQADPRGRRGGPRLRNPMHPVHDVFHRAMAKTLQQSGNVEVVQGEPARRLVQAGGGLGARLRYRLPVASEILSAAI